MIPEDKKRALWFVLALALIFGQGLHANYRAEKSRAAAMIDAAEIKALVRWGAIRPDTRPPQP